MMEEKPYYEINLPYYLQHDLDEIKKSEAGESDAPYDCLWCELYGSINSAYHDGEISEEHAWYLRERYLGLEVV